MKSAALELTLAFLAIALLTSTVRAQALQQDTRTPCEMVRDFYSAQNAALQTQIVEANKRLEAMSAELAKAKAPAAPAEKK